mmetsp:Transcript_17722/g.38616  ORF Transcript_17722/g.38616 Transcript_17722/m.38616 type:complete len:416 (+) Transcript_17722:154-1401(+)
MSADMFSPFKLQDDLELSNRIIMAPMTRARCTPSPDASQTSTLPNDIMVEYYQQRASAGLIITEATAISEEAYGWKNAPMISTPEHALHWKKVTDAIHAKDGKVFIQLWHMGRQSHSSFHPTNKDIVSASAVPMTTGQARDMDGKDVPFETPRALTVEQIQATIQDYVKAARLSKEAGFDGIEIHAANGYLLDQFLQSRTNQRTDQYGGSHENRTRILQEILAAIIADGAYPASRIGVRLSPNGNFGDMGSEDNHVLFPYVASQMNAYGLAYLHVMDGLAFGNHDKGPLVTAMDIKKHFTNGPLMVNCGLETKDVAAGMLRSGTSDLFAYGRPFISNPDLVERFQNDWPLNPPADYGDWYSYKGASGYTDFPFYSDEKNGGGGGILTTAASYVSLQSVYGFLGYVLNFWKAFLPK